MNSKLIPLRKSAAQLRRERVLRSVKPNAGIEAMYRAKLHRMVEELHHSTLYWVRAGFRAHPPRIAQDASPADWLRRIVNKLRDRWTKNIDDTAEKLGAYFSQAVAGRSDAALKKILRDGGFSVKFTMTPAMKDVLAATVQENVSLIKSIPAQYFTQVEGIVARGVATGNDLSQISKDLQAQFGVSKRRASLIARHQTSSANATLTRARQLSLGLTRAVWVHSHAGKVPRRTHAEAGREKIEFDLATGWWDPEAKRKKGGGFEGAYILPGTLIGCRCVSRVIIPALSAKD